MSTSGAKASAHRERTQVTPAEIKADSAYSLDTFTQIVGFGRHAMRAARRAGLRVVYVQHRGFVLGQDFLAYLAAAAEKGDRL
jgi:hypothetical protein